MDKRSEFWVTTLKFLSAIFENSIFMCKATMNDGIVQGQTYGQDNNESTLPWAL